MTADDLAAVADYAAGVEGAAAPSPVQLRRLLAAVYDSWFEARQCAGTLDGWQRAYAYADSTARGVSGPALELRPRQVDQIRGDLSFEVDRLRERVAPVDWGEPLSRFT